MQSRSIWLLSAASRRLSARLSGRERGQVAGTAQNAQSTVDRRIIDLLALVPPLTGSQGSLPKSESSELDRSFSDGSSSQMGLSRSTSSNLSRKTAERSTSESSETETTRRGKAPPVSVSRLIRALHYSHLRCSGQSSREIWLASLPFSMPVRASHGTAEAPSELTAACYARSSAIFKVLTKRVQRHNARQRDALSGLQLRDLGSRQTRGIGWSKSK